MTITPSPEGGAVVAHRGPAGGTVTVAEGSRAVVAEMAPFEIVLSRGKAHAVMPPAGNVRRPALRIATPAGTIEVPGSAEVWVEVARDGRAWVATFTGLATVATGTLGEDGAPIETEVAAGRAALVAGGEVDERAGPTRLEDAEARAREAFGTIAEAPPEAAHAEAVGDLVETLAAVEEQMHAGDALAAAQRRAEPAEARRIQREIVAHAQRMHRLRRGLLVRWERARASGEEGAAARVTAVARALGSDAPGEARAVP